MALAGAFHAVNQIVDLAISVDNAVFGDLNAFKNLQNLQTVTLTIPCRNILPYVSLDELRGEVGPHSHVFVYQKSIVTISDMKMHIEYDLSKVSARDSQRRNACHRVPNTPPPK